MKKLIYILVLLSLIWLVKITYDGLKLTSQVDDLKAQLLKSEQVTAHLNDQLIAMQRKSNVSLPHTAPDKVQPIETQESSVFDPTVLMKQQLELVKFAVEQQQYVYAIEQLNRAEQMLEGLTIAETLKQSLKNTLLQDKTMIQQYAATIDVQQKQLNEALKLIDRSLRIEQNNTQLQVSDEQQSFLSRWFKLEQVEQAQPQIINRKLILKEQQLRIISAQQALNRADFIEYQAILNLIEHDLNQLPDAYSVKLKKSIQSLQKAHLTPMARLNSLAILES